MTDGYLSLRTGDYWRVCFGYRSSCILFRLVFFFVCRCEHLQCRTWVKVFHFARHARCPINIGCIITLPASEFFQSFHPKSVWRRVLCNWPEIIVSGRQSSHHLHLLKLLLCDADWGLVRAGPLPPPTTSCCVSTGEATGALREGLLTAENPQQSGWSCREREANRRKRRAGGRCGGA